MLGSWEAIVGSHLAVSLLYHFDTVRPKEHYLKLLQMKF